MEQKRALVKGICEAVAQSFHLPTRAIMLRIEEIRFEDFAQGGELRSDRSLREGRAVYGDMVEPRINVRHMEGYTWEMKKELVKRLTDAVVPILGVTPNEVRIFLQEMKNTNFSASGVLASDELPKEHPPGAEQSLEKGR
jgi:4-oxalocrotonate tautomerase